MTLAYYTLLALLIAAIANNYSMVRRFRALAAEKYPDHPELDSLSLLASPLGLVLNLSRLKHSRVFLEFPEQERKLLYTQRRTQAVIFVLFALSIFMLALQQVAA
jgi:hypothetical protein